MREDDKLARLLKENRTLIVMCIVFIVFTIGAVSYTKTTVTRFMTKDAARTTTVRAVMALEPELEGADESEIEIVAASIVYRGRYINLCDASETIVEQYYDDYCVWNFIALIGGTIIFALIAFTALVTAISEIKGLKNKRKVVNAQPASQP